MTRPAALAALFLFLAGTAAGAQGPSPAPTPARLTADEAVAFALRNSPTLEAARHERNAALLGAGKARPAFRPEVSASASQILRAPRVDLPGRPDEVVLPNSISRLEVSLRQQLYQFGVGSSAADRAEAMAAAARSEYRTAELDVALEARTAYLEAVGVLAQREVAARGAQLARDNVELTRLLIERGFQAEVDLLQAQRAAAEAEVGVARVENGLALAKANVNRVMGRPIETEFELLVPEELPDDPPPFAELYRRALEQRPELLTLEANIAQAEAGIRLAKAQRLPRVDLEATYALQTRTALLPQSGVAAGVTIRAPILNGPVDRFTIGQAEERLKQVRAGVKARESGIALEIERHRRGMLEARKRRESALAGVQLAQKAYDIRRLNLERGRAIQAEVEAARLDLIRALADVATAENDLRLARARLDRAIGEGAPLTEEPAPKK